jgi:hypothetical protein
MFFHKASLSAKKKAILSTEAMEDETASAKREALNGVLSNIVRCYGKGSIQVNPCTHVKYFIRPF